MDKLKAESPLWRQVALWLVAFSLVACGGGGGSGGGSAAGGEDPGDDDVPADLVSLVRAEVSADGLDGDPANGMPQVVPSADPLVELGMTLFFSRTLSGRMDVACASCHHPDLGGGDGLTLPIGVDALQPEVLGLGREINPDEDASPVADGGPNVPRNSQTLFNVALYDRALFHDGRVFVMNDEIAPGGQGQDIRTPESGNAVDPEAGGNLLEAQSLFPLVSHDEMRGYMYPDLTSPDLYRDRLMDRLRGQVDQDWLAADAARNWESLFAAVFDSHPLSETITISRTQEALAAYQRSQIFIESPWKRFVQGSGDELSEAALRGALLFFRDPGDGGLGCAACHAGDHFTNEAFYNVGFPQIGRGKRADRSDRGRAELNINTRTEADMHAFRVPTLLNVALTAPYGHAGTFSTLGGVLRYHANPREEVDYFDFGLGHLPQAGEADGRNIYPDAETMTREVIAASSFATAEALLPSRALDAGEVSDLKAFLQSLTDDCAADGACRSQWTPGAEHNPDGNLLIRGQAFSAGLPRDTGSYPETVTLDFPSVTPRSGFSDMDSCQPNLNAVNQNRAVFIDKAPERGANVAHGFSIFTWLGENLMSPRYIMPTMIAGGVASSYVNDDCWPDIVFAGGDIGGTLVLENRGQQLGFQQADLFADDPGTRFANVSLADLNGDYRREILLGNLQPGYVPVMSAGQDGRFVEAGRLPMDRNTYGIAFGNVDADGYPEIYMSHWGEPGIPGRSPALFMNNGSGDLTVGDSVAGVSEQHLDQRFQFSPSFADFTGNGRQDLVIASDFGTSVVLWNDGGGSFVNVTDYNVITDEFGMGAAVADFDNDRKLDWFVTSIHSIEPDAEGAFCTNWSGNRLYQNRSTTNDLSFEDISEEAGVRDGGWGWGACAADFNNDGAVDIFHVNGMNELPMLVSAAFSGGDLSQNLCMGFAHSPPRLFINNGDGTFSARGDEWGLDFAEDGRGVTCFDYDRDGDMDIVALDHSRTLRLLENQTGNQAGHRFVNIRLEGLPPNTEALGAHVYVTADLDGDGTIQARETQLRVSAANSNFASQNAPDLHFGLGAADQVDELRVVWPNDAGNQLSCTGLPVNQFLVFSQQDGPAGTCP